jgi:hypothetical protein
LVPRESSDGHVVRFIGATFEMLSDPLFLAFCIAMSEKKLVGYGGERRFAETL